MGRDTLRRDIGLLLLSLVATASFALAATGQAGSQAFLIGLLVNVLSQRFWKRELNRIARPRHPPPLRVTLGVFLAVILGIGIIHWSGTPVLSAFAVCAVASACQTLFHARRVAASCRVPTAGLPN